jgi:hypothetical protein
MALIKIEKDNQVFAFHRIDPWGQFETTITKWKKFWLLSWLHDFINTCKDKWRSISSEFKKIFDYMFIKKHNDDYCSLNSQDKTALHIS